MSSTWQEPNLDLHFKANVNKNPTSLITQLFYSLGEYIFVGDEAGQFGHCIDNTIINQKIKYKFK